jgi:hypothetical protein
MKYKVVKVSDDNRDDLRTGIEDLERQSTYPIGNDSFTISHGADYFAFFEALGELHYYVVIEVDSKQVVAVGAAILRTILWSEHNQELVWYLCDLKVHPQHQGRLLSLKLLTYGFFRQIGSCRQAYMVSMNPPGGAANNPVAGLLASFRWAPIRFAQTLLIYNLSLSQLDQVRNDLIERFGELVFATTKDKKDIILQSNQQRLSLFHLQHGPAPLNFPIKEEEPDGAFMFCLVQDDPLINVLDSHSLSPMGEASILSLNFRPLDWSFILTSDI